MTNGKLYLVPNSLGGEDHEKYLPHGHIELITSLQYLVVENVRNARRYLKVLKKQINIDSIRFYELNKHTDPTEVSSFLEPATQGHDIGMLSEAGLPGIADPGAELVRQAHVKGIPVKPLVGPSSLFLGLMASGMNGQSFRFSGYLPVKRNERIKALKELEDRALHLNETQIFIETPYRNNSVFEDICTTCGDNTMLAVAVDLTTQNEFIGSMPISRWKKNKPDMHKRPAVFIIGK